MGGEYIEMSGIVAKLSQLQMFIAQALKCNPGRTNEGVPGPFHLLGILHTLLGGLA